MRLLRLLAAFVACESSMAVEEENGILVLNDANFAEMLGSKKFLVVDFYAPWCGHCKELAPKYAKAATQLPAKSLAKVDCTANAAVCQELGIQGYPQVKFFHGKEVIVDFDGERDTAPLVNWVTKLSSADVTSLDTNDDADVLSSAEDRPVVIAFGSKAKKEADIIELTKLSLRVKVAQIAWADSSGEVAKHYGVDSEALIMLKQFDEKRTDLDIKLLSKSTNSLAFEIDNLSMPLVIELGSGSYKSLKSLDVWGASTPRFFLFMDETHSYVDSVKSAFTAVAGVQRGQALHVIVHTSMLHILHKFRISRDETPALLAVENDKSYEKYQGAMVLDQLTEYKRYVLAPHTVPDTSDEPSYHPGQKVKTVTARDFEKRVLNAKTAVLLYFYLPTCRTCGMFSSKYLQLGKLYADNPSVVIARMDASSNVPEHLLGRVARYPTFKLFRGGSKDTTAAPPVEFEGGMEYLQGQKEFVPDISNFIVEQLKLPAPQQPALASLPEWVRLCPKALAKGACKSEDFPEVEGAEVSVKMKVSFFNHMPTMPIAVTWCHPEGEEVLVSDPSGIPSGQGITMDTSRGHHFLVRTKPQGGGEGQLVVSLKLDMHMRWRGWDEGKPLQYDVKPCENPFDLLPGYEASDSDEIVTDSAADPGEDEL